MHQNISLSVLNCNRKRRCGYFKHCDTCARLRQARFADKAQALFAGQNSLYLVRLTPDDSNSHEIERVKSAIKRQLNNKKALWTVEQGEIAHQLHLNLITPVKGPFNVRKANIWVSEPIKDLRSAAAYILKPDQYPSINDYSGRQFGTFNNLQTIFMDKKSPLVLQAAAVENYLITGSNLPEPYLERQREIAEMRKDQNDYQAIAARNLPALRAYIASLKGSNKGNK